jgi:hypothetical protein
MVLYVLDSNKNVYFSSTSIYNVSKIMMVLTTTTNADPDNYKKTAMAAPMATTAMVTTSIAAGSGASTSLSTTAVFAN